MGFGNSPSSLRRCFDWRTLHAAPDRGRRDNTKNNKRNRLEIVCLQNYIRRNTETTIQFRHARGILTISYRDAVRDERITEEFKDNE